MKKLVFSLLAALMSVSAPAATLSGMVKDVKTNTVLEFANVAVHRISDDAVITGSMSGVDGTFRIFNVPAGEYYLVVGYMGYEAERVDNIVLDEDSRTLDVGSVLLKPVTLKMGDVLVEAEKPAVSYKIDKRVVDASQFLSARGGTAIDIL